MATGRRGAQPHGARAQRRAARQVGAAFVVPAGYEPLYDMRYPVIDGSGGPAGYVRVRTTGSVVVVAGNNALIDLAPIRWAIT
jgi:hypothetical protein